MGDFMKNLPGVRIAMEGKLAMQDRDRRSLNVRVRNGVLTLRGKRLENRCGDRLKVLAHHAPDGFRVRGTLNDSPPALKPVHEAGFYMSIRTHVQGGYAKANNAIHSVQPSG